MKKKVFTLWNGGSSKSWLLFAFFFSLILTVAACFSTFYFCSVTFDSFENFLYSSVNERVKTGGRPLSIKANNDSSVEDCASRIASLQASFPSNSDNGYVYGRIYSLFNEDGSFSFSTGKGEDDKITCPILLAPYMSTFVSYLGTYLITGTYEKTDASNQCSIYISQGIAKKWMGDSTNFSALTGKEVFSSTPAKVKMVVGGVLGNGNALDRTAYYASIIGQDFVLIQDSIFSEISHASFVFEIGKSSSIAKQKIIDNNQKFCSSITNFCRSLKNPSLSYLAEQKTASDELFNNEIAFSFSFYLSTQAILSSLGWLLLSILAWFSLFVTFLYELKTMRNLQQNNLSFYIIMFSQYFLFFPLSLLLLKGNPFYTFFISVPIFVLSGKNIAFFSGIILIFVFLSTFSLRIDGVERRRAS